MFWVFLCVQVVRVLSEGPPPPQRVQVDKWQMTWTAAAEEENVTYSVQCRSLKGFLKEDEWKVVPACMHTPSTSCHVTKPQDWHGCVMLRVQAESSGVSSPPVEACSVHGDSCTPEFRPTAGPGSLTVHLNRNHSLFSDYGGHVTHRIYFGREEEQLQELVDTASSWTVDGLQAGQRYCVKVEYVVYNKRVGLPSCRQCEVILKPENESTVNVAVGVVLFAFLILIILVVYVLLFHRSTIKKCLQPPCEIPPSVLEHLHVQHSMMLIRIPSEEYCDVISSITPRA